MNLKPIPQILLGDSVTLQIPSEEGFGEQEIFNIRVERTNSIGESSASVPCENTEITVWYDFSLSYPAADFTAGMRIIYRGETYEINEVKVFKADTPHHLRLKARKINGEYGEVN